MGYIQGNNREQQDLFPLTIDEMVLADSPVRLFDAFVESLNLAELGFEKSVPSSEGRPAYNPADLLKLYLYGYFYGIRSSRKLARECYVNIEVMWLINQLHPDFRTISDFRKDNKEAFPKVFREFNRYCWQLGILSQSCISIDGSKFKAVNSRDKNFTQAKLDEKIEGLNRCIKHYLEDLEKGDLSEDKIDEINNGIEECKKKITTYQNYQNIMLKEGKSQISLTDPDSKLMKSRDGFSVCYNNQTAVDAKSHLIAGFEITNRPCDFGLITEIAGNVKEDFKDFGEKSNLITTIADKGYQDTEDMMEALENGIVPNVIQNHGIEEVVLTTDYIESEISEEMRKSSETKDIQRCLKAGKIPDVYKNKISKIEIVENTVIKSKKCNDSEVMKMTNEEMIEKAKSGYFVRNPEANVVYCPQGKILYQERIEKNDRISYRNRNACKNCRSKCANIVYKYIRFRKDETIKPANSNHSCNEKKVFHKEIITKKVVNISLHVDKELLAKRQTLSEHPFGTIKRSLNAYYLLLKGKQKVRAEMSLIFLAYNLKRAINIVGTKNLMNVM